MRVQPQQPAGRPGPLQKLCCCAQRLAASSKDLTYINVRLRSFCKKSPIGSVSQCTQLAVEDGRRMFEEGQKLIATVTNSISYGSSGRAKGRWRVVTARDQRMHIRSMKPTDAQVATTSAQQVPHDWGAVDTQTAPDRHGRSSKTAGNGSAYRSTSRTKMRRILPAVQHGLAAKRELLFAAVPLVVSSWPLNDIKSVPTDV